MLACCMYVFSNWVYVTVAECCITVSTCQASNSMFVQETVLSDYCAKLCQNVTVITYFAKKIASLRKYVHVPIRLPAVETNNGFSSS